MRGPVFAKRRGGGRALALFLVLVLLVGGWGAGLFWFAADIPRGLDDADTPTDAIVVLTGGAGRLRTGLDLLAERRAKKLFVSGVYQGVDVAELLELAQESPEAAECCIVLGYSASDTISNASETAEWMGKEDYRSLRLVTAAYHMRRSLLEFRRIMPEVRIVPHPVFSDRVKLEDWWRWPGTAMLIVTEYNKYLAAVLRHLIAAPPAPAGR